MLRFLGCLEVVIEMKLTISIVAVLILTCLTFLYIKGENLVLAGWNTKVYPPYFLVATLSLILLWLVAILYFGKKIMKIKR